MHKGFSCCLSAVDSTPPSPPSLTILSFIGLLLKQIRGELTKSAHTSKHPLFSSGAHAFFLKQTENSSARTGREKVVVVEVVVEVAVVVVTSSSGRSSSTSQQMLNEASSCNSSSH